LLKPSLRSLIHNWWMVVVWLGVIRMESTDMASAHNTSFVLYKVLSAVAPHVRYESVELLNAILRKTGHFLGYGILSALVFFALRNTNRDRLRPLLRRPWGIYLRDWWRREWVVIAILFTIVTAACDEIHQTFIPSRTGRWQDVVIDSCGAAVIQVVVYLLTKRALSRKAALESKPALARTL
jgi:VanZ family protein